MSVDPGSTPTPTAEEAERWLRESAEWRTRVSDALGLTWQELHGGE